MPELPEVEVTRRGIAPYLDGAAVRQVVLRHAGLRWPFPAGLDLLLGGKVVLATERRGKYLLLRFEHGTLLLHLGMSGRLRFLEQGQIMPPVGKHDHVDLVLNTGVLRMTDPRRFGAVLWHPDRDGHVHTHPLLAKLGLEPLEDKFNGSVLYDQTRHRQVAVKQMLLAGDIVVGVGNIYASESLFKAGIHPETAASRISKARYEILSEKIRLTLSEAITLGGSTLRDFIGPNGAAGYFQQTYFVYDRAGLPCRVCDTPVRQIKQGQRSTFYCPQCQKK